MVLLLRTDLRIRSILKLANLSTKLGLDPRHGGTSGIQFIKTERFNAFICRGNCPYPLAGLEFGVTFVQGEGFPIWSQARSIDPWRTPSLLQLLHILDDLRCERGHARIPVGLPCAGPSGHHDHHHLCGQVVLRPGLQDLESWTKTDTLSAVLNLPNLDTEASSARGTYQLTVFHSNFLLAEIIRCH